MPRTSTGTPRLVPMTVKVDPEVKEMVEHLAGHERRVASSSGNVLLQYGILRWVEAGNLQRLIDDVDRGWAKTLLLRQTLKGQAVRTK